MLVGIIAMIGSFLVGTLGKDYLISVNAQMYGWTPTYSYSITDSDFQDSIKTVSYTHLDVYKRQTLEIPADRTDMLSEAA